MHPLVALLLLKYCSIFSVVTLGQTGASPPYASP